MPQGRWRRCHSLILRRPLVSNPRRGLSAGTLELIAKALKVDVKDLLGQKVGDVDVIVALRADKGLGKAEKDYIEQFIENAKKRHGNRRA